MSYFTVDIYTPNKVIAKGVPADSLHIPTVRGEIQILPEHTHLITKLDTGVLSCHQGKTDREFLMTTGIVKVLGKEVTILAQVAEPADYINSERAQKALEKSQSMLNGTETLSDFDIEKYRKKFIRANTRINLAKKYKK